MCCFDVCTNKYEARGIHNDQFYQDDHDINLYLFMFFYVLRSTVCAPKWAIKNAE